MFGTNKKPLVFFIGLLVVLVLSVVFFTNQPAHKSHRTEAVFVSISQVKQQDTDVYADAIGNVVPHASVAVKSLVDGQLVKVDFKEGDAVVANQELFIIDQRPFAAKLQQANATLVRDQAQLDLAKSLLDRNSKLVEGGYISKQDYDQLKTNLISLSATVQSDQAAVKEAQLQLDYCTIRAPISGQTGSLAITAGNLVKASDQTPLVIINQIAPIDIRFSISEKQFLSLRNNMGKNGTSLQAHLIQNPQILKDGWLSFTDNTVDPETGMIKLKALFSNTDQYFWPGQFVKVKIPIMHFKQALLVPTRAIQIGQDSIYVFVVDEKSSVTKRQVTLGPAIGMDTIITDGLKPAETVVTEGQLYLTNGSKVQFKQPEISPSPSKKP